MSGVAQSNDSMAQSCAPWIVVFVVVQLLTYRCVDARRNAMTWVCMDACGEDHSANMAMIAAHGAASHGGDDSLTAISQCSYQIGTADGAPVLQWLPNGHHSLDILRATKNAGLLAYPLIGCNDLATLRVLFANPAPVIEAALRDADAYQFDGYNIDFEPEGDNVTMDDGARYMQFITTFCDALHAHRPRLDCSIDVADWQPNWWNYTLLASTTSADKFMTMDTYDTDWANWQLTLSLALAAFPVSRLGVGLQTAGVNITQPMIDQRFAVLNAIDGTEQLEVDVWTLVAGSDGFYDAVVNYTHPDCVGVNC